MFNIIDYAWDQIDDLHKVGFGFALGVFSCLAVIFVVSTINSKREEA